MPENPKKVQTNGNTDPTLNVKEMFLVSIENIKELREAETRRVDGKFLDVAEKFKDIDVKYQIQFTSAKEAVGIASTAQEKLVAQALDGTKEAINKADVATDKRFSLLSEKIDGVMEIINKSSGSQSVYVTHTDLSNEMDKLRSSFESMLRPVVNFMNAQVGKSSIEDPIVNELRHEVKKMRETNAVVQGTGKGMSDMWGWIVAALAALFAILAYTR